MPKPARLLLKNLRPQPTTKPLFTAPQINIPHFYAIACLPLFVCGGGGTFMIYLSLHLPPCVFAILGGFFYATPKKYPPTTYAVGGFVGYGFGVNNKNAPQNYAMCCDYLML